MAIDPLSAATAFSTIISLISDFRTNHKEVFANDHQKFLEWLSDNRHEEVKVLIESNQSTVVSIKAILNQDFNYLSNKLESIDNKLAYILSSDDLFSSLVASVAPLKTLPAQAMDVLKRFEELKASRMFVFNTIPDSTYSFQGEKSGSLMVSDKRFINDDLSLLVRLNLLTHDIDKHNTNIYTITRIASNLVSNNNT